MRLDETHRPRVESAFADRALLSDPDHRYAIEGTLAALDRGELRVASPPETPGADWVVHAWIQQAILLFFAIRKNREDSRRFLRVPGRDPLKKDLDEDIRVVPPAVARYSAYLEPGCILMPSYVNVGARVGSRTMIDTWATVGSCAQIGRDCHLSGGSGSAVSSSLRGTAGHRRGRGLHRVAGDRRRGCPRRQRGRHRRRGRAHGVDRHHRCDRLRAGRVRGFIPPRSVVIPGVRPKKFPAGEFGIPCALIIGQRTESTDRKVSLNAALRDFAVAV